MSSGFIKLDIFINNCISVCLRKSAPYFKPFLSSFHSLIHQFHWHIWNGIYTFSIKRVYYIYCWQFFANIFTIYISDLNHIGALIEMPPLYENLTAYENLKVRTTVLGLTDKRIDEVLQIVRLTETGKKRAGQFSLGMKQRLGIAVALLNNPKLLILDEPTNGLDPIGIEELRELIRSFPAKGITVILSSHILSEVQQTADHIGIIAGGVLGYEGKLNANENLEQLFMDVVKSNHREG